MKTYDDLLEVGENSTNKINFLLDAISEHKGSIPYHIAKDAEEYSKQRNTTIMRYQKLLYNMKGMAVPDNYSANYKMASNFFDRFVTQLNQYLIGNGVSFNKPANKDKLGEKFDFKLQKAGRDALVEGCSFGFWNADHLETFKLVEFVPLYAEETGALMAGIRFWQVAPDKPLRITLYEMDGLTEYIKRKDKDVEILKDKRPYLLTIAQSKVDGMQILDGRNYPTFPIVPLWGNPKHQSELVGLKEEIDAYDLIKSGFANDLDDASMIYWTLENCGGMDDIDLVKFIERMKTVKAAVIDGDGGAKAEAHTLDIPYQSREVYLARLEQDMYKDFQALDVSTISAGAKTATEINASYQPLDNKADQYEYEINAFMDAIMALAGIDDKISFTRSKIINKQDEIQTLIMAAEYLDSEYITRKVLDIIGDADKADEILDRMTSEEAERFKQQEQRIQELQEQQQVNQDNESEEE